MSVSFPLSREANIGRSLMLEHRYHGIPNSWEVLHFWDGCLTRSRKFTVFTRRLPFLTSWNTISSSWSAHRSIESKQFKNWVDSNLGRKRVRVSVSSDQSGIFIPCCDMGQYQSWRSVHPLRLLKMTWCSMRYNPLIAQRYYHGTSFSLPTRSSNSDIYSRFKCQTIVMMLWDLLFLYSFNATTSWRRITSSHKFHSQWRARGNYFTTKGITYCLRDSIIFTISTLASCVVAILRWFYTLEGPAFVSPFSTTQGQLLSKNLAEETPSPLSRCPGWAVHLFLKDHFLRPLRFSYQSSSAKLITVIGLLRKFCSIRCFNSALKWPFASFN